MRKRQLILAEKNSRLWIQILTIKENRAICVQRGKFLSKEHGGYWICEKVEIYY